MYKRVLKPLFFYLSPEAAHDFVLHLLKFFFRFPLFFDIVKAFYTIRDDRLKRNLFGLSFKNPVGLAAGFDKDAKLFDELSAFGFGFIEIGTVTPRPQHGNVKPRMFRLIPDEAIINRMGFNHEGVLAASIRLKKRRTRIIVGGNIGKNGSTTNENAVLDYEYCFEKLFDLVDYFVVNVSSPNSVNLRDLQEKEPLKKILIRLQDLNTQLANQNQSGGSSGSIQSSTRYRKPLFLKIAPDLSNDQIDHIIETVYETKLDGIVATNTTVSRGGLKAGASEIETIGKGGLSGKPLKNRSTEVIRYITQKSGGRIPIIASGGVHTTEDAIEKIRAGASLVQIYTGLIYEGPGLVKKICKGLLNEPVSGHTPPKDL